MIILALDLGTSSAKIATKTYATVVETDTGAIDRASVPTTPESLLKLVNTHRPQRVVLEVTRGCGWVVDLLRGAGVPEVQVANPMDDAWRNRSKKTDKHDADLLARLSATGQLRTVHIPEADVRNWRELIDYRHHLIAARTRIKNRIKALLSNQGKPTGKLWNEDGIERLKAMAKDIDACAGNELWQGMLSIEVTRLSETDVHLAHITKRLNDIAASSSATEKLMEVDGVGPRAAEIVVATLDDPLRFSNRKDVASYFGLAPRVTQSGAGLRLGRITKAGDKLCRSMLVEIVHLGTMRPGWIQKTFAHYQRGDPNRRNTAIVATARRLAVILWAKFRDHRRANPDGATFCDLAKILQPQETAAT